MIKTWTLLQYAIWMWTKEAPHSWGNAACWIPYDHEPNISMSESILGNRLQRASWIFFSLFHSSDDHNQTQRSSNSFWVLKTIEISPSLFCLYLIYNSFWDKFVHRCGEQPRELLFCLNSHFWGSVNFKMRVFLHILL